MFTQHNILHTADWHLGVSTGAVSRIDDQSHFLDWLCETLEANEMDTLVVAGDIFDTMNPSAGALNIYYKFLSEVGRTGISQVVIVGGNHDSPNRLDAPAPALKALDVHVVGGYSDDRDRMVIPLRSRGSQEVTAVCLAVPYMHEYRLGVRTTLTDHSEARRRFAEAFGGLYTNLVDRAMAAYPGVPIVATGHLTLAAKHRKVDRDDYPQEIHQIGTIDAMSTEIIDPRIDYSALGHIHRAYPVLKERNIWYSGTPVPYSLKESQSERVVLAAKLEVTAPGSVEVSVKRHSVPLRRALVEVRGTREEVTQELRGLTWQEPEPPLVHAFVVSDSAQVGLNHALYEALDAHDNDARPALVEIRQVRSQASFEADQDEVCRFDLEQLQPNEVFEMLLVRQRSGESDEVKQSLKDAFEIVRHAEGGALEAHIPQALSTHDDKEAQA